jgi:GT2 family glycosyltransferase
MRAVRAIEQYSRDAVLELIVVDDASSSPAPPDLPAWVRVIYNGRNLGYQASVNVGFGAARGDWVLLLDSDAYPLMDVVEPAARAFEADAQLGAIALGTVNERGERTESAAFEPQSAGFVLGPRGEGVYMKLLALWAEPPVVLYSCALAVRRAAFESIGGFDEAFDFLDADLDFSMRLAAAGWRTRYEPSLVAFHRGSGSPQTLSKRVLRCYRNRWRLLEKHHKLRAATAVKVLLALRHTAEIQTLVALRAVTRGQRRAFYGEKLRVRKKLIRTVWTGYRDAIE